MNTRIRLLLILLLANLSFGLDGVLQSDSLRGSLGDVIRFQWNISHSVSDTIDYSFSELDGTGIEILSETLELGDESSTLSIATSVYDSVGYYQFPDLILYAHSGANRDSLKLRGPELEIFSILSAADSTFRDIKGLHRIKTPLNWLLVMWIVLTLILIYLLSRIPWIRKRTTTQIEAQEVIVAPEESHLIALRELESLRRSKFLSLHQFKVFHSQLVHILKQYIERRYVVDALDLTSNEFMNRLSALNVLTTLALEEVNELLNQADLIKFAKAQSNELDSGKALSRVVELVNTTKIENDMGDDT